MNPDPPAVPVGLLPDQIKLAQARESLVHASRQFPQFLERRLRERLGSRVPRNVTQHPRLHRRQRRNPRKEKRRRIADDAGMFAEVAAE